MERATFKQAIQFLKLVDDVNLELKNLQDLYDSGLLSDLLTVAKRGNLKDIQRVKFQLFCGLIQQKVFRIRLNYDEALETKVAAGFSYADPNLTDANFINVVRAGQGDGEAILVNFGQYMESDYAVRYLDAMDLRPGIPKELADLSKSHPNSQDLAVCLPIVALGDSWQAPGDCRKVGCLFGVVSGRELGLYWWGSRWLGSWWFLAFRK